MTLQVGDLAPEFMLLDAEGEEVTLSQFRGRWVVLYFYPRDSTPGCTKEACGFRDRYPDYQSEDIVILGVSSDDAASHQKFSQKYQLPFILLSDPGAQVAQTYGSYGEKQFMGKRYEGTYRQTFLIAPNGTLAKLYPKVKPEPHAAEVLQDVMALKASQ